MQQRLVIGNDAVVYRTAQETMMHIWRIDGLPGFYRGILAHILRSTPQATITLMCYEYTMRALERLK